MQVNHYIVIVDNGNLSCRFNVDKGLIVFKKKF